MKFSFYDFWSFSSFFQNIFKKKILKNFKAFQVFKNFLFKNFFQPTRKKLLRKKISFLVLKESWFLLRFLFREHVFSHKKSKKILFLGFFSAVLVALSTGFLTSTLRPIFDYIFQAKQAQYLPFLSLVAFFFFLLKGCAEYGFNMSIIYVNQILGPSLQLRTFRHMMNLPFDFFQKTPSGSLTTLLLTDIEIINNNIVESLGLILSYSLQIIVLFGVMCRENFLFALFFLGGGPFLVAFLLFLSRRIHLWTQKSAQDMSRLHTFFLEICQNILFIRSSFLQKAEIKTLEKEQALLFRCYKDLQTLRCFIHPSVELFSGLSIVVLVMFGGYQVIQGQQTTGSFMTFLAAMLMLYQPIKNTLKTYTKLEEGLMAVKRIKRLLSQQEDKILTTKSEYFSQDYFSSEPGLQKNKLSLGDDINFHSTSKKQHDGDGHRKKITSPWGKKFRRKFFVFLRAFKNYLSPPVKKLAKHRDVQKLSWKEKLLGETRYFIPFRPFDGKKSSSKTHNSERKKELNAVNPKAEDILQDFCDVPEECSVNFARYRVKKKIRSLFEEDLRVENLCFSYESRKNSIFHNMSCVFPKGQSSLLMGPSGSGKSTFFYLLLRLYEAQKGDIFLGATPLSSLHPEHIAPWISWVGQQGSFFSQTILHNLLYGLPLYQHHSWKTFFPGEEDHEWKGIKERVVEATHRAQAHDFIQSLPEGYHTVLGPRGLTLSGGQRQRLSLARAFLKDAPLVLLDEATSALDKETEKEIFQHLKEWGRDKTILSISHNREHCVHYDHVFMLSQGIFVPHPLHYK